MFGNKWKKTHSKAQGPEMEFVLMLRFI